MVFLENVSNTTNKDFYIKLHRKFCDELFPNRGMSELQCSTIHHSNYSDMSIEHSIQHNSLYHIKDIDGEVIGMFSIGFPRRFLCNLYITEENRGKGYFRAFVGAYKDLCSVLGIEPLLVVDIINYNVFNKYITCGCTISELRRVNAKDVVGDMCNYEYILKIT